MPFQSICPLHLVIPFHLYGYDHLLHATKPYLRVNFFWIDTFCIRHHKFIQRNLPWKYKWVTHWPWHFYPAIQTTIFRVVDRYSWFHFSITNCFSFNLVVKSRAVSNKLWSLYTRVVNSTYKMSFCLFSWFKLPLQWSPDYSGQFRQLVAEVGSYWFHTKCH